MGRGGIESNAKDKPACRSRKNFGCFSFVYMAFLLFLRLGSSVLFMSHHTQQRTYLNSCRRSSTLTGASVRLRPSSTGPLMSSGCRCGGSPAGEAGTPPMPTVPTEEVDVAELVSQEFFDGIVNHVDGDYPGKRFYTRAAFMEALASFPGFGSAATPDDSRREVAAFFAHATHETGHFRFIEEICDGGRAYRDESRAEYPCAPGKRYYGRGPLQLTWNYNYGAAGKSIGFDLLGSPETVAEDPVVSFKTALWYWMERVRPATKAAGMVFGATIRAINGGECGGRNPKAVERRVRFYKEYCERFGVAPGNNLTC